MRSLFGKKCAKISLDAGFTCPNIDSSKSTGGCIYCLSGSSGAQSVGTLAEQYKKGKEIMMRKWRCDAFIPYLQAHTNTYAPTSVLEKVYEECANFDGAVMLSIATRADCLSDSVVSLLRKVSERIPLTVELGLQSVHDRTAKIINRAHTFAEFEEGYRKVRAIGKNVKVAVHLINGLPGETHDCMIESAVTVGALKPDIIKFHLLYVLKGTPLAKMYYSGEYAPMEKEDYVNVICDQLERIPDNIAIGRITGDAPSQSLIAPEWSKRKTSVANDIDKELYRRGTWQGIYCGSTAYISNGTANIQNCD